MFSIIVSVRETCADWLRGVEPQEDPALRGKKDDDSFHSQKIKVPRRNVGPSSTQVLVDINVGPSSTQVLVDINVGLSSTQVLVDINVNHLWMLPGLFEHYE